MRKVTRAYETEEARERRFWAKVYKRGPDECWPWGGYIAPNGYGSYGMKGTRLAHRIAYQYAVGPIPADLLLDHLCHTRDPDCPGGACAHRSCVNPGHAQPVVARENLARGRSGDSWGYVPPVVAARLTQLPLACANGCVKPIYKRDLCRPCYRKWLKDPGVERPSRRTPEQRFWAKVQKTGTCWLWTASLNQKTGYAQFFPKHGKPMDGHRYSYLLAHGSIPDGHDVHHTCHVRRCVNPDHLRAATRKQNVAERKNRRAA